MYKAIKLPSNKKFGLFFGIVFFLCSLYFYVQGFLIVSHSFIVLGVILILISFIREKLLIPFNRLWMSIGLFLGIIINPIVLGFIFFGLFTPIRFVMKLFGRDELLLNFKKKKTHWINRVSNPKENSSFKNQF